MLCASVLDVHMIHINCYSVIATFVLMLRVFFLERVLMLRVGYDLVRHI